MNNIEKLDALIEKGYEIARRNPTKLALEFKQSYYAEVDKIKHDRDNSDVKKAYLIEELQGKYGKELFKVLAEMKAEYKKTAAEAQKLAQSIHATDLEKPEDSVELKLFESALADLKAATMLGANAKRSIEAIDAFIGKYGDNPYYAQQVKEHFPTLAGNVLGIEGTLQNRHALSKVLERIEAKATTPEREKATETLQFFGDGDVKFYLEGTAPYQSYSSIIGDKAAAYLNRPEEALAQIEAAITTHSIKPINA